MGNPSLQIQDDIVVSLNYLLRLEDDRGPQDTRQTAFVLLQGRQQVVPGLEQALYGMKAGEEKDVVVEAARGYGEVDPAALKTFPRQKLPSAAHAAPGAESLCAVSLPGKFDACVLSNSCQIQLRLTSTIRWQARHSTTMYELINCAKQPRRS